MDFQKAFHNAIITSSSLKKSICTNLKSPHVTASIGRSLAYVQAYGSICASYPYYYEISELDVFCLLCTQDGAGLLKFNNRNYTMKQGTIAFFDCNLWHRIEIKKSPWAYKVFFINGPPVSFFYDSFKEHGDNLHTFLPGSSISDRIELMYHFLLSSADESLTHAKYTSDILFELLIEKNRLHNPNSVVCDCIYEIKHHFDCKYMDNVTLEGLEQKYHVSRYHICREFAKRFHMSPIQYLNYRKIEAAKEALLRTDKKVNEIGKMLGFENANNFIRNFKKRTGITPLEYRKQFIEL